MDRFDLLGGQSNLLSGQMPTQFTRYLPPWLMIIINWYYHDKHPFNVYNIWKYITLPRGRGLHMKAMIHDYNLID